MGAKEKTQWTLTKKEAEELQVYQTQRIGLQQMTEHLTAIATKIEIAQAEWWVRIADNHNIPSEIRGYLIAKGELVRYAEE